MRKLVNLIFLLPLALVLILLSVANRQSVRFSLDPLNLETPAVSLALPFFIFLFAALIIGIVIGGTTIWFAQGKHRKELRAAKSQVKTLQREIDILQKENQDATHEIAPGLPAISNSDKAA